MAVLRISVIGAGLLSVALSASAAEQWFSEQLAISDGSSPIAHQGPSMQGPQGRPAAAATSESDGFLSEQLALTDGAPYALSNGVESKGPAGRRAESTHGNSDLERQLRITDGAVN